MILPPSFFDRPAPDVARDLLGQRLVRQLPSGARISARITETEAYDGFDDRASHAHRGPTPRNAVMFGPPAHIYLYLCYGIHWLLNLVTGPRDHPAAVLLRGTDIVTGPGRLTRHFHLDNSQNTLPLGHDAGLWVESAPFPAPADIHATPRVGIHYAGPHWAAKPWRFLWSPPA